MDSSHFVGLGYGENNGHGSLKATVRYKLNDSSDYVKFVTETREGDYLFYIVFDLTF